MSEESVFPVAIAGTQVPISWCSVGGYADKIAGWNELRRWGFTESQVANLATELAGYGHLDSLHPTGVAVWLGHSLAYNWNEAMAVLRMEIEPLGEKFEPYTGAERISFFRGSEHSGDARLTVALLDLATHWVSGESVVPSEVRQQEEKLPGLEIAWLLALNPEVYRLIDYSTVPGLVAGGLVVDAAGVPNFGRDTDEVYVGSGWSSDGLLGTSVARFREE
jgi:hypothetical protein